MRKQKATYWEFLTNDGMGGRTFSTAVEIDCRWEDRAEQLIDADGEEFISQSLVYVDRQTVVGSYLKLGDIAGSPPADPTGAADSYPIRKLKNTPNFKNTETLYEVFL